jgi:hypothetical protein
MGKEEMGMPTPEKKESEYRTLTIASVRETNPPGDTLLIDFKNSVVSFELRKDYLSEHGLSDIAEGDSVEVKGKYGNKDVDLFGLAKIEDIRKLK